MLSNIMAIFRIDAKVFFLVILFAPEISFANSYPYDCSKENYKFVTVSSYSVGWLTLSGNNVNACVIDVREGVFSYSMAANLEYSAAQGICSLAYDAYRRAEKIKITYCTNKDENNYRIKSITVPGIAIPS